jgi:hypothetical protein
MEEILVNINYLIREKLWGSVKALVDKVCRILKPNQELTSHELSLGAWKRTRCRTYFLESVCDIQ